VSKYVAPVHKFSSTQIQLPAELHSAFKAATKAIPDSVLAADGRESEPHVTALYGLHDEDPGAAKKIVSRHPPVKGRLGFATLFKNDEHDVVKMDVHSPGLHALNADLKKLPNSNSHPEYKPHVTLAYVKAGHGDKFDGKAIPGLTGKSFSADGVTFSSSNGKRTHLPFRAGSRYE